MFELIRDGNWKHLPTLGSENQKRDVWNMSLSLSLPLPAAVLCVVRPRDPAQGARVSQADGHGPAGDPGQGTVLRPGIPSPRAHLPHDGLPQ